jgi:uncharacterized membrane protein YqjE
MDLGRDLEALTASTSNMVALHVKLARLELVADLQRLAASSALLLAAIPLGLGAFVLLTVAAVNGLARFWPLEGALAALAAVYAGLAAVAFVFARRAMAAQ